MLAWYRRNLVVAQVASHHRAIRDAEVAEPVVAAPQLSRNDSTAGDSGPSAVHSASPYSGATPVSSRYRTRGKRSRLTLAGAMATPIPAATRLIAACHDPETYARRLHVAHHLVVHVGRGPPDHRHDGLPGQLTQPDFPHPRQRVVGRQRRDEGLTPGSVDPQPGLGH